MHENQLAGQVAIISGGLGDIGRAIAIELARRGADIAIGDMLAAEAAVRLKDEISSLGRRCRYDVADVSDASAVARWIDEVMRDLGTPPTIAVPNAAVVDAVEAIALSPQQWRRQLRVNLDGAFYLAQAAARRMLETKKPGRIVFVGSWAAHAAHVGLAAYCASKAGVRMLCQCMARELAEHDILVNEVAPGYVDAGLSGRMFQQDPDLRERCRRNVPVQRLIDPEDVALEVAHLCDPRVRHTTGATIVMDGGLSLVHPGGKRND